MTPSETTSEEKSSRSYWGFVLWPFVVAVGADNARGPWSDPAAKTVP